MAGIQPGVVRVKFTVVLTGTIIQSVSGAKRTLSVHSEHSFSLGAQSIVVDHDLSAMRHAYLLSS
jgi:hypothetical protein